MSYSNQEGRSPISLSDDLKIYSGTAVDGDAIATEVGNVQKGSLYISTNGDFYHKYRITGDGNAWYKIAAGTPETDESTFTGALTLTPAVIKLVAKPALAGTLTLTPAPARLIKRAVGAAITPAAGTPTFAYPGVGKTAVVTLDPGVTIAVTPA